MGRTGRLALVGMLVIGVVAWRYVVPLEWKDGLQEARHRQLMGEQRQETYNNFGPITLRAKKMAKTQVPGENLSYSFTFRHALWPGMDALNLYIFDSFNVGDFNFMGITDAVGHPGEFAFRITHPLDPANYEQFWYTVPATAADIYWIEIICTWTLAGNSATKLTSSSQIIGEKSSATHAKEMILTEAWYMPAGTSYSWTINSASGGGVTAAEITAQYAIGVNGSTLDCDDWSDYMVGIKYVLSVEDLAFASGAVPIDTSSYAAVTWGETAASVDKLWVEGFGGNSIGFWASDGFYNGDYVYNTYPGGAISAPFSYDFSGLAVLWMDGTAVNDSLQVYCTGLRNLNASGIDIGPWHGTLAALIALGRVIQIHGCYYWDTWDADMSATVELYLDLTSAESLGIEIRGPQPEFAVAGAGYGVTGTSGSPIAGPYDGPYSKYSTYNDQPMYSNGYGFLYCTNPSGPDWGIGPGPPTAPYYIQEGGGPAGVYVVNSASYTDDIIDIPTGKRRFSAWYGENIGPSVSASTAEAIIVDSDCATPAFTHDATFIFDAWPLDATNRDSASPYMTDIVSLSADAAKSVYADAHDHTDWVGVNCTTPDANGNFTVSAGGGSLTLTPKCNYLTRQALVGGVDEIAVPPAYRNRRHDSCLGQGAIPETAEAVWDWRRFYLRQNFVLPAVPMDVVCTIQYYMDLLGASDNHKTDSTRQTLYAYAAGDLFTLERTIPVTYAETAAGQSWSAILADLYDEQHDGQPVAMAYNLKWTFPTAGVYRMQDPMLSPDVGDRQEVITTAPYYRIAPAAPGFYFKVDESWRYAQGVVSAHYHGLANMVLFLLDNAKACVIERCFDTLDVLIGAQTGVDMTTCFALSGWPITNSGEGFTWTHNAAAEAAHMMDVDNVTLKTLQVMDIAPSMGAGGDAVAVRCFRLGCVNGLPYTFHGTKYVGGRGHGMAVTQAADTGAGEPFPRKRSGMTSNLYRRHLGSEDDGDWALVSSGGFSVDEHSHWTSDAQPITDNADPGRAIYEYAIRQAGAYDSLGRFATREFADLQVIIAGGGGVYVVEWKRNIIFVFEHNDEGIQHLYTSPPRHYYAGGRNQASYDQPHTDVAETSGSPAGYVDKHGFLYLYHVNNNAVQKLVSVDMGQNWSAEQSVINDSISKAIELWKDGVSYCLAIGTNGALYCYRSATHFDDGTWTVGTNKFLVASGMEDVQPGGYFSGDKLYAFAGVGTARQGYESLDLGRTWSEIV